MKTFEKVLEIFQDYLSCDLEEEVLPCRNGYLRVTWNGDSRYCVDGLLSRTPDELFEVLLSDYSGYEVMKRTKGRREVTEEDENRQNFFARAFGNNGRRKNHEGNRVYSEIAVEDFGGSGNSGTNFICLALCGAGISLRPGVGAYQHGDRPAGRGGPADLFPAKWHYPAGDGISYQSVWSSNGCYLAAG